MKRFAFLPALALALVAACQDSPTASTTAIAPRLAAAETYTYSQKLPLAMYVWVSCANGGWGETIYLTGTLHDLYHYSMNNNTFSYTMLDNPQQVSGTGLTTGDKYQGTGVTRSGGHYAYAAGYAQTYTHINNFRMIGQGPGNNYLVHTTYHVTINPDTTMTSHVDKVSIECK